MKLSCLAVLLLAANAVFAQDPHPQPLPGPSIQTLSSDGITTTVVTQTSPLPPGQNFLMTQFSNAYDSTGKMMPNTLPSTPNTPFNLMSKAVVTKIDTDSPTQALDHVFKTVMREASHGERIDTALIQRGIAVLEGDPLPDNPLYNGFSLLNYTAPEPLQPQLREIRTHESRPRNCAVRTEKTAHG